MNEDINTGMKYKLNSFFCGIGGFEIGFSKAGFEVIWANDFDKYAIQTYNANFTQPAICQDLFTIPINNIPQSDVFTGGFPCQPFSMMGSQNGFEDVRGTLFFQIAEIIQNQKAKGIHPKVIVLENVRRLLTHDNGNTFATIKSILEDLGYTVFYKVLNSADFGVPQTRNRLFIVCFSDSRARFSFPNPIPLQSTMQDILESDVDAKYFLSERILKTILAHGGGNYSAKSEIDLSIARPLTATMAKMHRACQDNYITQEKGIRRLTPRECARLQGFPDSFILPCSDTQLYKQFGNSVTSNVAYYLGKQIYRALNGLEKYDA